MPQDIQSDAFRSATLRSERYRIVGLLIACAFFILVNFANALVHHDAVHAASFGGGRLGAHGSCTEHRKDAQDRTQTTETRAPRNVQTEFRG